MILVVSHRGDDHARAVLGALHEMGVPAALFDVASFPQQATLALAYGPGGAASFALCDEHGDEIDLDAVTTAWWRRPRPIELDPEVPADEAQFTYTECVEALGGLWASLDVHWVNDPARDRAAAHKVHQLRVAQEVGLTVPRTLVTNDPAAARRFIAENEPDPTVYKCFSATVDHWRETRVLRTEELELLDRVRVAPVIFQEFVPAGADLRVTVVGEHCFPAAIHSDGGAYPVDVRIDLQTARIEATELPPDVEQAVRRLLDHLGLVYGAVDLRRTPDGEHVFFEVNTSGQWRFVERRTGQPITDAVARTLAAGAPRADAGASAARAV